MPRPNSFWHRPLDPVKDLWWLPIACIAMMVLGVFLLEVVL